MKAALLDYMQLVKPRLTLMVLATALSGFYLASPEKLNFLFLFHTLIGLGLVGAGANALNQYLERTNDAKMDRTKRRPLPSLRIGERQALWFGSSLAIGGILYLHLFLNPISSGLGFITLSSYLWFYTPLKQKTWLNTFVGAVSGSLPTLIGWTAASGKMPDPRAWVLFSILFIWQMPHFFTIAWVYREDYRNGGFHMLSAEDRSGNQTGICIGFFGCLLFAVSLLPTFVGIAGLLYFSAAVFTGLLFLTFTLYVASHKIIYAKQLVTASIFYLGVLNIFLWFDKA